MPYSTGPTSIVFIVYRPLGYSPLVFNVCSSFRSWFVLFQKTVAEFCCSFSLSFYDFCYLVGWFCKCLSFVCLFSIYEVKELLDKVKVSALVAKHKDVLSLNSWSTKSRTLLVIWWMSLTRQTCIIPFEGVILHWVNNSMFLAMILI